MIPLSFDEWKKCITLDCGIALTPDFVNRRVAVLSDKNHPETRQFIGRYGEPHHNYVLYWFKQTLTNFE
jgi:hypothetical protein